MSLKPVVRQACLSQESVFVIFTSIMKYSVNRFPMKGFPPDSDWLMLGPTGPRRLRLAVEHLAQHRGGICFHVDLDSALGESTRTLREK